MLVLGRFNTSVAIIRHPRGMKGRLHCHGSRNCQINTQPHTNTQEMCKKKTHTHTHQNSINPFVWEHNGRMIIQSRNNTWTGLLLWKHKAVTHTTWCHARECVFVVYVKRNITLFTYRLCLYLHSTDWNTAEHASRQENMCMVFCSCVCVCTYSVRSLGIWLKLDRGMRVMLLLLRVLDGSKDKANTVRKMYKGTKEILFYQNCRKKIDFFLILHLPNKY